MTTDKVSVPRQGGVDRAAAPRIPLPRGAERRVLEVVPPVLEPGPTRTRQRHLVSTLLVVTADILAFTVALLVADTRTVSVLFAVSAVVWYATGLYARRFTISVLDDLTRLAGGVVAGVAALALVTAGNPAAQWPAVVAFGAGVVATRSLAYLLVRRRRAAGHEVFPTLLVGSGPAATTLAERIAQHPETGLRLEGWLHEDASDVAPLNTPSLGQARDLQRLIVAHDVSDVIVASANRGMTDLVDELRLWGHRDTPVVHAVPNLFEMHLMSRASDEIWGVPLETLRRHGRQGAARAVKRAMDVAGSGLALLALSPLLAVLAVMVRREIGPNILFRQERVGLDGRKFSLMKFRSIPEHSRVETSFSVLDQNKIGPTGRFIRRYSLDELPQLFNILRGDMSLVGPRPERPEYVEEFELDVPGYRHRHRVPVGLTGLAAVKGLRGNTSLRDRAYFDNLYIENWSLWLDVKIIARTVSSVLRGTGG